jgi:AraC family transcriptional regulator
MIGSLEADSAPARPATQSVLLQSILSGGRLTRRDSLPAIPTSQALDWPGVFVEAGKNDVAAVDDVVGTQHYLSLNVDTKPLTLEVKGSTGFAPSRSPAACLGESGRGPGHAAPQQQPPVFRVSIDPLHLGRLMGPSPDDVQPVRLRRTYGVASPQIARLMMTLKDEADSRNPGGLAFVEAVTTALGHLLVRHAGAVRAQPVRARGGLSAFARRRVLEIIHARLDARLTVEMLAHEAGLSPAHFARAFKETIGQAPHQYLLSLRLEHARHLVEIPGANLSNIAQRAGFADQAHFTRLFKRAYGITPGALRGTALSPT